MPLQAYLLHLRRHAAGVCTPIITCNHVYCAPRPLTPSGMSICLKILRHPTFLIRILNTGGRAVTAHYTRQYPAVTTLGIANALRVFQRPMALAPWAAGLWPGDPPTPVGPSHPPTACTAVSPKGGIFCVSTSQKKRAKL
jgi:hypothetical protein